MKITSQPLTFLDTTDSRKLEVYISSNHPTIQLYDVNDKKYTPDWSQTNLKLSADVFLDSTEIKPEKMKWYRQYINEATETLVSSGDYTEEITVNSNMAQAIVTYICRAEYQELQTFSKITFTRNDTGLNGSNGTPAPAVQAQYSVNGSSGWTATLNAATHKYIRYSYDGGKTWTAAIKMVGEDGTSVNIKGTATSKTAVSSTSYFTLVYNGVTITGAALGDAYLLDGNMYVCVDSRDGNDYFMDVGRIQGPQGNDGQSSYVFIRYATDSNGANMSANPTSTTTHIGICTVNTNIAPTTANSYTWSKFVGDSAKSIILTGGAQVFKVSKTNAYTPSTISVTATPVNTTVTEWSYSVNGGQTFLSTVPTGVTRNGNIVTVAGSTLASNSLVIKASDGQYSDVFTIYKAFDGADGSIGQSASMAFLTNENISFSANANGQVALMSFTTNVVAYDGTTKVTPKIGTISGLPSGMTVSTPVASSNEQILTFSIANNSNLGSASSNNGTITIPITSPVSTNLKLSWSKINTGATGSSASLVDITPSSLYFKSTTGANGTFAPQYIYLYPRFQNTTYSNWQYSRDGGTTWLDAFGANGLTIDKYNSVENSLRIERSSTLYTGDVTLISFRCNSTNSSVYDTVSIAKIYDVVDLQIGGTNLFIGTKDFTIGSNRINGWWNPANYVFVTDEDGFSVASKNNTNMTENVYQGIYSPLVKTVAGDKFTVSFWIKVDDTSAWDTKYPVVLELYNESLGRIAWYDTPLSSLSINPSTLQNNVWTHCAITKEIEKQFFNFSGSTTIADVAFFGIRLAVAKNGHIHFKKAKIERGDKATDWSPAPEDLLEEAANVNVMLSNESHFFESTSGGVPTETSIVLDVVGYKGSIQSTTTVGTITGLPLVGMTAAVSSNGTTNTKITISVTSALTSNIADYGALTIPITVNGHTVNKRFNWVKAKAGDVGRPGGDAVTFQVYSNNGYALSINTPSITLQTFAYVGDVKIQSDAEYQWYQYVDDNWNAIDDATNSYLTVSRDSVAFSNSYMCKMLFNNAEYVGVVTVDDKNDSNKVFTTKPSNYSVGDLWIVGADYIPTGVEAGTLLRAEHTNTEYADSDWIVATKYDDKIKNLQSNIDTYNQAFSFDAVNGVTISARDTNGVASQFSTSLTNERLSFNYGNESIAYINGTKMNIKEAEIESPLTVTGKYSGSTMLQAPVINIGNFSIIVESNGSLSIVANT